MEELFVENKMDNTDVAAYIEYNVEKILDYSMIKMYKGWP